MHLGESLEVVVDELSCLTNADTHALGKTKCGDAIDDAEVSLLGLLALCVGDGFEVNLPYFRSRCAVNVLPGTEGSYQMFVAREMGHDAQLYLAVVGRYDLFAC